METLHKEEKDAESAKMRDAQIAAAIVMARPVIAHLALSRSGMMLCVVAENWDWDCELGSAREDPEDLATLVQYQHWCDAFGSACARNVHPGGVHFGRSCSNDALHHVVQFGVVAVVLERYSALPLVVATLCFCILTHCAL